MVAGPSLFKPRPHVDKLVEEAREREKKGKRHLKYQHVDEHPTHEAGPSPIEKSANYGETPQKKQDTEGKQQVDSGPAKVRAAHGRQEAGGHEGHGRGRGRPEKAERRLGPVRVGEARTAREPVDDERRVDHGRREQQTRQLLLDQDTAKLEKARDGRDRRLAPAAGAVVREHLGNERGPPCRELGARIAARGEVEPEENREAADPRERKDHDEDAVPAAAVPRGCEERHDGKSDEDDRKNRGNHRAVEPAEGSEDERDRDRESRQTEAGRETPRPKRRATQARGRMRRQDEAEGRRGRGQGRGERRSENGEDSLNRRRMAEARGSARA
jgi:hypothetical protein